MRYEKWTTTRGRTHLRIAPAPQYLCGGVHLPEHHKTNLLINQCMQCTITQKLKEKKEKAKW